MASRSARPARAVQQDKTKLQQELLHQASEHERERNKICQQQQELSAELTSLRQEAEAQRIEHEEEVRRRRWPCC
jgi:hypothetical protein